MITDGARVAMPMFVGFRGPQDEIRACATAILPELRESPDAPRMRRGHRPRIGLDTTILAGPVRPVIALQNELRERESQASLPRKGRR